MAADTAAENGCVVVDLHSIAPTQTNDHKLCTAVWMMAESLQEPPTVGEYKDAMIQMIAAVHKRAGNSVPIGTVFPRYPTAQGRIRSVPGEVHRYKSIRVVLNWLSLYLDPTVHKESNTMHMNWYILTNILHHTAMYGGTHGSRDKVTQQTQSSVDEYEAYEEEMDEYREVEEDGLEGPVDNNNHQYPVLSSAHGPIHNATEEYEQITKDYNSIVGQALTNPQPFSMNMTPDHGHQSHNWDEGDGDEGDAGWAGGNKVPDEEKEAEEEEEEEERKVASIGTTYDNNATFRMKQATRASPYELHNTRTSVVAQLTKWDTEIRRDAMLYNTSGTWAATTRADEWVLVKVTSQLATAAISEILQALACDQRILDSKISTTCISAAATCPKPFALAKMFDRLCKTLSEADSMYVMSIVCHIWDSISRALRKQTSHARVGHWWLVFGRMTEWTRLGQKILLGPDPSMVKYLVAVDVLIHNIVTGPDKERFDARVKVKRKPQNNNAGVSGTKNGAFYRASKTDNLNWRSRGI
jgi:hypothetical protein